MHSVKIKRALENCRRCGSKERQYTRITWFGHVYANIYNRPNGLPPTRKFLATLLRERERERERERD